jgi:hypothetical protein
MYFTTGELGVKTWTGCAETICVGQMYRGAFIQSASISCDTALKLFAAGLPAPVCVESVGCPPMQLTGG